MTATAQAFAKTRYTVREYLALEESTGEKWEFFDGEVYVWEAMAGTTAPHAVITARVSTLIGSGINLDRCYVATADLKLSIKALRRYRYPDLSVVCGELDQDPFISHAMLNPTVLVEVTSKSSFTADYTTKAEQYMKHVPSLRDYLIVVQHEPFATLQSRESEGAAWQTTHVSGLDATIHLPSIDVTLSLREVYRNIVWVDGEARVKLGGGGTAAATDA